MPTLVIGGSQDRFYGADLFQQTARGIPHAGLLLLPRRGHFGVVTHRGAVTETGRFLAGEPRALR